MLVLGSFAVLAGTRPPPRLAACIPFLSSRDMMVATALSAESVLTYAVLTAAFALTAGLAFSIASWVRLCSLVGSCPRRRPGGEALPAGWEADSGDRENALPTRTLARASFLPVGLKAQVGLEGARLAGPDAARTADDWARAVAGRVDYGPIAGCWLADVRPWLTGAAGRLVIASHSRVRAVV